MGRWTDVAGSRGRSRIRGVGVVAGLTGLLVLGGGLAALAQQTHEVDVADDVFVPDTIEIEAGDTVRWTQSGVNPHTVTADDGSFDSHPDCPQGQCMMVGDTFEHTFDEPGEFGYHCRLHGSEGAGMSGTVVVAAAEEDTGPDPEPEETDPEPDPEPEAEDPDPEPEPEPERDESDADDAEAAQETLPETGAGLLSLALFGLLALGLGALWLRRPRRART